MRSCSYLGDHTEVVELLKMLSSIHSSKAKRYASMGDLVKLDAADAGGASTSGADAGRGPLARSSASIGVSSRFSSNDRANAAAGLFRTGAKSSSPPGQI